MHLRPYTPAEHASWLEQLVIDHARLGDRLDALLARGILARVQPHPEQPLYMAHLTLQVVSATGFVTYTEHGCGARAADAVFDAIRRSILRMAALAPLIRA